MRGNSRTIKGKPLEDKLGEYYGVCRNPAHKGIVRYSFYRICEKRHCKHYVKFRPENQGNRDVHDSKTDGDVYRQLEPSHDQDRGGCGMDQEDNVVYGWDHECWPGQGRVPRNLKDQDL